jgi:hypothetical protein
MTLYQAKLPLDPNPLTGFAAAAQNDIIIYNRGVSPSPVQWMLSSVADTFFAHFLTNTLSGGTAFYTYFPVSVEDIQKTGVAIYPNPATDNWYVLSAEDAKFQLYAADGRLVMTRGISKNAATLIEAGSLAPGLYYYKLVGNTEIYTGTLMKQ